MIGGIVAIFRTESPSPLLNAVALFGIGTYTAPVISIASLVGFITLFGIAVRNGILLVNHYRHLIEIEGLPLEEAIQRGSMERLVPILMTALTAALALVPMAIQAGEPGNEILAPLSIVISAVSSSTFLNLIVVPAGYALLGGAAQGRRRNHHPGLNPQHPRRDPCHSPFVIPTFSPSVSRPGRLRCPNALESVGHPRLTATTTATATATATTIMITVRRRSPFW